jgi:hypothetical protein
MERYHQDRLGKTRLRETDFDETGDEDEDEQPLRKKVKVEPESQRLGALASKIGGGDVEAKVKEEQVKDGKTGLFQRAEPGPSSKGRDVKGKQRRRSSLDEDEAPKEGEEEEAAALIKGEADNTASSEEFPGQRYMREVHKRRREQLAKDHLQNKGQGAYAKSLPRYVPPPSLGFLLKSLGRSLRR